MGRTAWATIAVMAGLLFAGPAFPQATAQGGPTPSPPGAKVEFIDIKDGAVIGPKTTIHFGLHGMGVAPAGTKRPNSGHHHLLVDTDLPPLDKPIPNDENHLHFGGGQTETELSLLARTAHAATAARRRGPYPPYAADLFRQDPRDGRRIRACPGSSGASLAARNAPSFASGRARLHRFSGQRLLRADHLHSPLRTRKDGRRSRRRGQAELRTSPSAYRRGTAAPG